MSTTSFSDKARDSAQQLAAACGAPKTREEGVRAIHAVVLLRHGVFASDQAAWEACCGTGTSARRRFYEWKKKLSAVTLPPPELYDDQPHSSSTDATMMGCEESGGSRLETRPGADLDSVLEMMVDLEPAMAVAGEAPEQRRLRLQRERSDRYRKREREAASEQRAKDAASSRDAASTGVCVGCGERRVLGMPYQCAGPDGSMRRLKVYSYRFKCGEVCEACHISPPVTEVDRAVSGALLRRQRWQDLTSQQQAAAACFGFSAVSWDARFGDNLPGMQTCRTSTWSSAANAFLWDQPPCTAERLGERFLSGTGAEFVWNGCGGCRGDKCKWRHMQHAISCAWWHAWEDLSVEQRLAAETLGYQARDWELEELAGATRWGCGECECMLGSECRLCTRPECAQQPECICWRAQADSDTEF